MHENVAVRLRLQRVNAEKSICRVHALSHFPNTSSWWSKNQHVSLEFFLHKAESVNDLQENKSKCDKREIFNNEDGRITYKSNQKRQCRGRQVMVVWRLYPPSPPQRHATLPATSSRPFNATEMSTSYLVATVESGEFDLDETIPMETTLFCRVFINNNHKTSWSQKCKNIAFLIPTRNWNFGYLRNGQEGRNKRLRQTNNYRQYRRNGWQNWIVFCCQTEMRPVNCHRQLRQQQ